LKPADLTPRVVRLSLISGAPKVAADVAAPAAVAPPPPPVHQVFVIKYTCGSCRYCLPGLGTVLLRLLSLSFKFDSTLFYYLIFKLYIYT